MLLPMIKTHDGVLKNTIKTFLVFFYSTPVLPRCDVIILTKFYKNANISSTTNGKLTKSVSNFRKFNNPSNELSLKWIISTCRTPWSVLIASGRFFEENYRRESKQSKCFERVWWNCRIDRPMGEACTDKIGIEQTQGNNRESRTVTSISSRREIHISEINICRSFRTRHPIITCCKFRSNAVKLRFSGGKYTFNFKGAKNVPIRGVDDKRQITGTFAVTLTGKFLPIQLIYTGKTKRSLPKFKFPSSFSVTCTENHWSNTEKSIEFFEEIIFPYLEKVKIENGYPEEQHSLVIMDTFKGQDNDTLKELCSENNCEVVIVPHNLTNKFQPLDISVNKAAKAFIQNLYNEWFSNQVAIQLKHGIDPTDVKISSKLSDLKPLHASWIVDLYDHLSNEAEMIINGFDSAGITEAVNNAQTVFEKVENPFKSL